MCRLISDLEFIDNNFFAEAVQLFVDSAQDFLEALFVKISSEVIIDFPHVFVTGGIVLFEELVVLVTILFYAAVVALVEVNLPLALHVDGIFFGRGSV